MIDFHAVPIGHVGIFFQSGFKDLLRDCILLTSIMMPLDDSHLLILAVVACCYGNVVSLFL